MLQLLTVWSSGPAGLIPSCATASARTMYSATPAASGAYGGNNTLDPLVLGLATRWLSDPGSTDPVPATGGLSDDDMMIL
jgi:hypothetical protein